MILLNIIGCLFCALLLAEIIKMFRKAVGIKMVICFIMVSFLYMVNFMCLLFNLKVQ